MEVTPEECLEEPLGGLGVRDGEGVGGMIEEGDEARAARGKVSGVD